jgi:poly(A) polymerase/tRNA nucleotidyltransferase (CCA-adding enzyme)
MNLLHESTIADELLGAGYECYLVGGAVRDRMLGKESNDIDYATDATPQEMLEVFPDLKPVGIDHGTILVHRDDEEAEITTYRTESTYSDNRRPDDVEFANNIREDLKRRDFTINAMAVNMADGSLVDPFNGQHDLARQRISTVGEPRERFDEDQLRVLRALRFAVTYQFSIGDDTLEAIKETNLDSIAEERIREELMKAMTGDVELLVGAAMNTNLHDDLFPPELHELAYLPHPDEHHEHGPLVHSTKAAKQVPSSQPLLRLATLLHDVGKVDAYNGDPDDPHFYGHEKDSERIVQRYLRRLRFSNDDVERVARIVHLHMFEPEHNLKKAVRRLRRKVDSDEEFEDLVNLRVADLMAHGKQDSLARAVRIKSMLELMNEDGVEPPELAISGDDVLEYIDPGPMVGGILSTLRTIVDNDPSLNRKLILDMFVREAIERDTEYIRQHQDQLGEEFRREVP